MSITNSGKSKLKGFLVSHEKFFIPDYQREYSWEKDEQVLDFFDDIKNLIDNDLNQHFFGQIVLHKDSEEKVFIIDGQQRVTTVMIFLAVIRDLLREIGEGDPAVERIIYNIKENFIGAYDDRFENIDNLKLILGENDKLYFKNNIQLSAPMNKGKTKSHERIYKCYEFLKNKLREIFTEDKEDNIKLLREFYYKLTEKFEIIFVETDDLAEAFIIFETLNARGKDLEISDLLKNYLFRESKNQIEIVKNNWMETSDNLGQIDITNYLRHFWNSRYPFTREKYLFRKITKKLHKSRDVVEFSKKFLELSPLYAALNDPNNDYFDDNNVKEKLDNLNTMKAKIFYPLILALVAHDFEFNDVKKVIDLIETFYLRNIVSKSNPNKFEVFFAELAYSISNKEIINTKDILIRINENIITDEQFCLFFNDFAPNRPIAKYVLREINDYQEKEIQIIRDNYLLNLEHIMPQNPRKNDWPMSEDVAQYSECIKLLGNLTLLGEEYNKSISNKPFTEKKEIYKRSKIIITNELSNLEEWTFETIRERQKDLCKKALVRWPKLSFKISEIM